MTMFSSRPPFVALGYDEADNIALHDRPQNNPTNPILTNFRIEVQDWPEVGIADLAVNRLDAIDAEVHFGEPEQLAHARRVFTRLSSFEGGR